MACTSNKATLHIFNLHHIEARMSLQQTSSLLSIIARRAGRSFAKVTVGDSRSLLCFVESDKIVVLAASGRLTLVQFDAVKSNRCRVIGKANFYC